MYVTFIRLEINSNLMKSFINFLAIFIGSLLLISPLVLAVQFNQLGWSFKQNITGNFLTPVDDYEWRLNVTFNSNMQSDFDDLRFTDVNNKELPFFIQQKVDNTWAEVFVRGNYTINGTQLIMYFGNPSVSTTSNGFNTFALFDDFVGINILAQETPNTTIWNNLGGGFQFIKNGVLEMTKAGAGATGIISKRNFTDGFIFETNGSLANNVEKYSFGFGTLLARGSCRADPEAVCYDTTTQAGVPKLRVKTINNSTETVFDFGALSTFINTFFNWKVIRNDTNNSVTHSFDTNSVTLSTNVPNASLNVYFYGESISGDHAASFEDVKVRKLISPFPIETFGSITNVTTLFNITFNITNGDDGSQLTNVDFSCNNTLSRTGVSSPHQEGFVSGSYSCIFGKINFFNKIVNFVADSDKIINVKMSRSGFLSLEEHTFLEALFDCIVLGIDQSCEVLNLLENINETTTQINITTTGILEKTRRTDQSVVVFENITNKVLTMGKRLTIDYIINVPVKEGFGIEEGLQGHDDFLPIRLSYWFLNETNIECFDQGSKPEGVIGPACFPLTVQTVGQIGTTIDFTVTLKPSGLPSGGEYTVIRSIDIDPEEVWINYGREAIGKIYVLESSDEPFVGIETKSVQSSSLTTRRLTDFIIGNPATTNISIILSILTFGLVGYILIRRKY